MSPLSNGPISMPNLKWWAHLNRPDYYWLTRPLAIFLATRLILFSAAYIGGYYIPDAKDPDVFYTAPDKPFLDIWARWDSVYYLSIAGEGYHFVPGKVSSVAFFPLYPLLVKVLTPVLGSALVAGWTLSNLAFFGSLMVFYKLTEFEFRDHAVATRAVLYIAVFPTAFFFSAVYTESLFLLLSVSAMYFARRGEWGWAALMGVLCSATRIVGVILWGVVLLEWLKAHGWTMGTLHRPEAWRNLGRALRIELFSFAIICLIPLGLISYMIFLKVYFGDGLAFLTTQSAWDRHMVGPWVVIWGAFKYLVLLAEGHFWSKTVDSSALLLVLIVSFFVWRRLGENYALYSLLSVLIPASTGLVLSLSRYDAVVFPVFMMLAWWGRRPVVDRVMLITSSVLLGVFTAAFVNWVFVA